MERNMPCGMCSLDPSRGAVHRFLWCHPEGFKALEPKNTMLPRSPENPKSSGTVEHLDLGTAQETATTTYCADAWCVCLWGSIGKPTLKLYDNILDYCVATLGFCLRDRGLNDAY